MKNKRIVIAGGSGFIGEELISYFGKENQIVVLTRQLPNASNNRNHYHNVDADIIRRIIYIKWDARTVESEWMGQLEGADLVINLAGKSVNCRYTHANKKAILESRTHSTRAIADAILKCKKPPSLWINASSATIYRHALDRPQDEYTGEIQDDFSVQVCKQWEESFYDQPTPYTRKVALRMAITLGSGGVLIPYFNLIKFGLGGRQGSGRQMYSWIHSTDTCRMIEWIAEHENLEGTYNCSSPNPVTNAEFMRSLRKATAHRFGLPAWSWMLKAGGMLIGTEAELVLKSRWVLPTRILETGFQFKYPLLGEAFAEIMTRIPRKQYRLF